MKSPRFSAVFLASILICLTACQSTAIAPNPDGSLPTFTHLQPNQNKLSQIAKTPKAEVLDLDARWSGYAEYMQKLIKSVKDNWYAIMRDSDTLPEVGKTVNVTFKLQANGQVIILKVEETTGKPGAYACINAIQKGQPYGKWTGQMISALGSEQTITFSFLYE